MKRQIKMIGLDCDGTLLNDKKELTDYSRRVLVKALSEGIVVLPATGRPLTGLPREVLDIPGVKYALTSNGARIVELDSGKVLYESLLPFDTASRALAVFEKYDTYQELFLDGSGYGGERELSRVEEYAETEAVAHYMRQCRIPVPGIRALLEEKHRAVDKVHAVFRHQEEKQQALRELGELEGIVMTCSMSNNIEVNAADVNKGTGLLKLGELLGISREEIMACGDATNDLAMIREAGLGVAVGNAVEEVRRAADYVTDTNENDGVAKAIEKFALK